MKNGAGASWRRLNLSYKTAFMNLAVEEAIARAFSIRLQQQPTLRFWVNPKSVVLGRFQEASLEADLALCRSKDIQVVRRFTGGGAVFHDEATLNLSILKQPDASLTTFQESNLRLVLECLSALGVQCTTSPPNSILVEGRKVCGAAAAMGKRFALWHCSILIGTDTSLLELALTPSQTIQATQFVRSRWQPITNVSQALHGRLGSEELIQHLETSLEARFNFDLEATQLSRGEEKYAEELLSSKYSLDEWNLAGNHGLVRSFS